MNNNLKYDFCNDFLTLLIDIYSQGENQRLRSKHDTIDQTLKKTRDAYEEKIKEFTRQIKNLEESKEKQSKLIDEMSAEIDENQ